MFSIWWSSPNGKPLWHRVEMFALDEEEAMNAARALSTVLKGWRWAYGPTYQDGITEVSEQNITKRLGELGL